jgi:hypothetical protein
VFLFLCFACIGTPPTCSCFVCLYAGPQCGYALGILHIYIYIDKPFSLLSALWGFRASPSPPPPPHARCTMHGGLAPAPAGFWVSGLRLVLLLLCPVFCLLNSLPPACVFVFCLLRHSLPPACVLCLVRSTGPPRGKKMRPSAVAQKTGPVVLPAVPPAPLAPDA